MLYLAQIFSIAAAIYAVAWAINTVLIANRRIRQAEQNFKPEYEDTYHPAQLDLEDYINSKG